MERESQHLCVAALYFTVLSCYTMWFYWFDWAFMPGSTVRLYRLLLRFNSTLFYNILWGIQMVFLCF